jgi:chitodextrinase
MTVSAWIRAAAFPFDDAAVVSKRTSDKVGYQLDTTIDTGPRTIGFKLTTPTGAMMARYGASALQLNQWYYLTGVYDAAARTLNVYLNGALDNGTLIGTVTSAQQNSALNVNIGRRAGAVGYAFNGTIDEVRIYDRCAQPRRDPARHAAIRYGGGAPSPADASAPSAPGTLTATASGSTQVNLAWGAASDNVGVTGYRVERCAGSGCASFAQIATPTGTSFSDTALSAATSYSYRVRAADAAGNLGAYSNAASATTAQAAVDLTPPTAPATLSAAVVGSTQINLAWAASTDNVGVAGYRVERCAGSGCTSFAQIATPTGTSFNDASLTAGTSYSYRVRASDAAGNLGAYSNAASATTASISSGRLVAAYWFQRGLGCDDGRCLGQQQHGHAQRRRLDRGRPLRQRPVLRRQRRLRRPGQRRDAAARRQHDRERLDPRRRLSLRRRRGGVQAHQRQGRLPARHHHRYRSAHHRLQAHHPTGAMMARYGASALQLNQWYYLTGVYDAAARTLNVYLNGALDNGTLIGTVTSAQQNSALNVNIGRRAGAVGYAFNGTIDEVRIYDRALSPAEIQLDMQLSVTGGGAPSPADASAPSAPGTLTATASGSTQVNLAWGAASDNVGVTGYRVERCAGSGCASFAQIATPTGTSFSDTALSAATSYSYRVRAADAAGNLGTYSNTAGATTPPRSAAKGPLTVLSGNPRWLGDGTGNAVFLRRLAHLEQPAGLGHERKPARLRFRFLREHAYRARP